jgi:hypothetical protein
MYAATIQAGDIICYLDTCKTPAPPAPPIPIPYVNIAMTMMAMPTVTQVLVCGCPTLNLGSKISISSGDEPGVAGGLISGSFIGECQFTAGSSKVTLKGKPAVRMLDPTKSNKGNCFGSMTTPSQVLVTFG